jgi:hypothetical protein
MSFSAPEPIASATPYAVTAVGGRAPRRLTDFVGDRTFTLKNSDRPYDVAGVGADHGDVVRFHEKDAGRDGKDVRVWQITLAADGGFVAEHVGIY